MPPNPQELAIPPHQPCPAVCTPMLSSPPRAQGSQSGLGCTLWALPTALFTHGTSNRIPVTSELSSPSPGLRRHHLLLLPSVGLPPITETAAAGQVGESSTSAVTTSQQTTAPPIKTEVHSPATGSPGSPQLSGLSFLASLSLVSCSGLSCSIWPQGLCTCRPNTCHHPWVVVRPHYAQSLCPALSTSRTL